MKKLWRFGQVSRKMIDEDQHLIPSRISVLELDRDSEVVLPSAFADGGLDNYAKNPVVLWGHERWSLPVARTVELTIAPDHLYAVEKVAVDARGPAGEMARSIWDLVLEGVLSAKSIGFYARAWSDDPVFPNQKGVTITKAELLEHSWVSVPSAPSAVVERSAKGLTLPGAVEAALTLGAKYAPVDVAEWGSFLQEIEGSSDLQAKLAECREELTKGFSEWAVRHAGGFGRRFTFTDDSIDDEDTLRAEVAALEELVG